MGQKNGKSMHNSVDYDAGVDFVNRLQYTTI